MRALSLPFRSRFIVLTLCIAATATLAGLAMAHGGWLGPLSVPILLFGGLSLLGIRDLFQTRHAVAAELPDLGAPALYPGRAQAGDAAVLLREREGRHAVQPRQARG